MRLLLLLSQLPYPTRNGEDLRIFELAKRLASSHEIHVLAYKGNDSGSDYLQRYFSQIHLVKPVKAFPKKFLGIRFIDAFRPTSLYPFDAILADHLTHLIQENQYDWLWIPAWQMIPYVTHSSGVRVLLDVMDDGVLELARETRYSRSPKTLIINVKRLLTTALFERTYFPRATGCCLVTDVDAQVLKRIVPTATVVTVPNGVDSDYFSSLKLSEDYPSLTFEGNMSFGPSVDAMVYFCREIFPLIAAKIPATKLWIVGRNPTAAVRNLESDRVLVTGSVEDVRPYLDRSSVFVCPMRKGAGIKNKLLQAWAMAKPVVATSIATAGLSAVHQENILIADTKEVFASEVVRLLQDSGLRQRIGHKGRQTVVAQYTWERRTHELEDWMSSH